MSQKGGAGKTTLPCTLAVPTSPIQIATAILDLYLDEDRYIPDESRSVLSTPARTHCCVGLPRESSVRYYPRG